MVQPLCSTIQQCISQGHHNQEAEIGYIFQSLLDMLFADIFSHPVACLIILLTGSVAEFFLSSLSFLKNTLNNRHLFSYNSRG